MSQRRKRYGKMMATYPPYQRIKGEGSSSSATLNGDESSIALCNYTTPDSSTLPIDWPSIQGKFGWTRICDQDFPFILRGTKRFCSVRMIETIILNMHFDTLHLQLYSCTNLRSYSLTLNEANLLSSINEGHCGEKFGRTSFNLKDLLIELEDAENFYNFLQFCYKKLLHPHLSSPTSPCGFLRINNESDVSYILRNGEKYVPLFYFDGVSSNIREDSVPLNVWESAYLKFCCKIQGIKEEHLKNHTFLVVRLSDLKRHFPPETTFVEYWLHMQARNYFFGNKHRRK